MQPKNEPEVDGGPPNPTVVLLFSLFAYPGVGHFMVGARKLGLAFVLLFTGLTVGIIYEMWILAGPLFRLMTQGDPMTMSPNWARIAFWIIATGIVWVASGVHSFMLARHRSSALPGE